MPPKTDPARNPEVPADERFRDMAYRDLGAYQHMLNAAFSRGPGREPTVNALLRAVDIYRRLFFILSPLARLGFRPTSIPRVFVCERDGQAVAALCVRRVGSGDGPLYLVHLAVDEAYRRQGIATRLLGYVETKLLGNASQLILTRALADNEPQLRNRQKAGFTPYARQTRFVDRAPSADRDGKPDGTPPNPQPAAGATLSRGTADPGQLAALRWEQTPASARDILSSLGEGVPPLGAPRAGFPLRRVWRSGWYRDGRLVAGALLYFHRLQGSYELDLAVAPGAEDLGRGLVAEARRHVHGPAAALHVNAHDFESALLWVLDEEGLVSTETRVLLAKRR